MLKNYFKVAFRSLLRNKSFSFINISGLAIGMASATLILLWIADEVSFDRFHANGDRLAEVWSNDTYDGQIQSGIATPEIMAPILKNDVPEIEKVARITWGEDYLFTVGDNSMMVHGNVADPDFLSMFNFPLIKGDLHGLDNPYSIVLTEKLAKRLYGNEDPIGKTLSIQRSTYNYSVTAVLKDLPANTQFDFEYLTSYAYKNMKGYIDSDWTDVGVRTFVLLKPHTTLAAADSKLKDVIPRHSGGKAKTAEFLYPVSKLRLYSNFENGIPTGGRIDRVRIFSIIAAFILLIACINFMNLSTARSEKRAREVGIRKVIGARKQYLIAQFLGESVLMAILGGILALAIVQLCLPSFNLLVQKKLSIDYSSVGFWLEAVGFILFTGILAGSYPAFYLSAFNPIFSLKGMFKKAGARITPRKTLVVLQFTISIALIICTMVVVQQMKYGQRRETGYDRNNLGYVFMQGDIFKNYSLIKNTLLSSGVATSVSKTQAPLTQNWSSGMSMNWQGKDPNTRIQINRFTEDGGLIKTAGMQLVAGRDIDVVKFPTDSTACLVSESAVKAMGFKNPIGQTIFDDPLNWHVVGVIKDFILESPYEQIKPFMIKGPRYGGNEVYIKLNPAHPLAQNLAGVEKIFKTYNPAYPFEFHFSDQEYSKKFSDEQLTATLASLFAGLTVFISCLGLFGLASFMAENRLKEIGVRKVLGASVINITALLSGDFIKLVLIAVVIASPIAYWAMDKWLHSYNYRITISPWIFAIGGLLAIFIALLTISFQSIKAALGNPVRSLRTE